MERNAGENLSESEWIGAEVVDEKPSAIGNVLIYFICATLVLATLAFGMVDSYTLAFFVAGAGVVGWLWLADAWKTGELRYSQSLLPFPVIGLILIGLFQLLPLRTVQLPEELINQPVNSALSLDAFATRLAIVQLTAMLVYFVAVLTFINNQKRLRFITATLVTFGFLMAVIGITQFFGGGGEALWIRKPAQAIPFASFINRHHFGAFMVMTMGLTLGLIYTGAVDKEKRLLHVFAVVIMGIGLILTTSRGALLSFFGVLAFLTLATFFQRRRAEAEESQAALSGRIGLIGGGLALIAVMFGAVLLLGGDTSLLRSIGVEGVQQDDPSSGRLHFWQKTLQMIADYPLTGVGLNAFGVAYPRYDTWNGYYRLEQAHNDYLQVLAEAGVIGLLLVAAFIFLLFHRGLGVYTTTRDRFRRGVALGALAGCFGILIHSFFDFPLRTSSNQLVFLVLAALATTHISHPKLYRRKSRKHSSNE